MLNLEFLMTSTLDHFLLFAFYYLLFAIAYLAQTAHISLLSAIRYTLNAVIMQNEPNSKRFHFTYINKIVSRSTTNPETRRFANYRPSGIMKPVQL